MIRLTLILALALFAIYVLVPREADEAPGDARGVAANGNGPSVQPGRSGTGDSALTETESGTLILTTTAGEELVIDLVVEPSDLTTEDAVVNLPPAEASGALEPVVADAAQPVASDEDGPATAEQANSGATRLRVTGDRVNFRAGPSTDDAILAALTQGTELELIERVADGWAHLRVPETGLSGYMSEDFLEAAN